LSSLNSLNYLNTGSESRAWKHGILSDLFGNTTIGTSYQYPKPVQPVIYQKPQQNVGVTQSDKNQLKVNPTLKYNGTISNLKKQQPINVTGKQNRNPYGTGEPDLYSDIPAQQANVELNPKTPYSITYPTFEGANSQRSNYYPDIESRGRLWPPDHTHPLEHAPSSASNAAMPDLHYHFSGSAAARQ